MNLDLYISAGKCLFQRSSKILSRGGNGGDGVGVVAE